MVKSEKIHKICCITMCWMPFVAIVMGDVLDLSNSTRNKIWLIMLLADIALVLVGFKIAREVSMWERILSIIALVLLIGCLIYVLVKL